MLSPEDQNRFRGNPGGDDSSANSEIPAVLKMMAERKTRKDTYLFARSHDDRFIPLMMRFFDFNDNNRIRFCC
ncbi:MAG: hypothetical protein R3F02_06240 [Thiolinea sp.]